MLNSHFFVSNEGLIERTRVCRRTNVRTTSRQKKMYSTPFAHLYVISAYKKKYGFLRLTFPCFYPILVGVLSGVVVAMISNQKEQVWLF